MELWKKVLKNNDKGNEKWELLRKELKSYMKEGLGLNNEKIEEYFRVEYALKKELGIIGNKDER